jgi:acetyl-CoA acetyltransferase
MGNDVYVAGIGMTRFTVHLDKTYHQLAALATDEVLKDAGLNKDDIEAVFFSNSLWGHFEKQHCIRGQVALRPYGLLGRPIMNVENACSSGSSALYLAYMAVKSGELDAVLCLGVEKVAHPDRALSFESFTSGFDVGNLQDTFDLYDQLTQEYQIPIPPEDGKGKSKVMDTYGVMARWHMSKYGTTQEQLAKIAVKNRFNGSLNPLAHWQEEIDLEKVMADRVVSFPITRPMCAPIGDGAAAVLIVSEQYLNKLSAAGPVKIRAMAHSAGTDKRSFDGFEDIGERLSRVAYNKAGVGPEDIDIAEVHDATAYGELHQVECLGFTPEGTGGEFIESGKSALNGAMPINTSGGLIARGHPIGASGLGQIYELVTQIRGNAAKRQVPKQVRMAMAENGGGVLTIEEASMTITILEKV